MIGVISRKEEVGVIEEFFQLFKTPWEWYRADKSYDAVIVTNGEVPETSARLVIIYGSVATRRDQETKLSPGTRIRNARVNYLGAQFPVYGELLTFGGAGQGVVCSSGASGIAGVVVNSGEPREVRIGYDLFQEVAALLTTGQPVKEAHIPTLDLHIEMLRDMILDAGIELLEIPPTPAGYDFSVCLTHDIDFVGIRRHKFDHTMWGFLYRATAGAALDFLRRKTSLARLLKCWQAAFTLPFVYLGWAKDFWMPFEWYLKVEKGLSPTYYFIPFKHRRGEKVTAKHAARRATMYDITDIPNWVARLRADGCEVGVHGIDAWHSVEKGREELARVAGMTGQSEMGVRMHWLLRDENTYQVLEEAGYSYDSTAGYNETPGYRCGTAQTFRPLSARKLLELPMHIQDGALFFPDRLGLSEAEAWQRCESFVTNAEKWGGALTVLWHDRSPGPERFWGDFYVRLVENLKSRRVWFGNAMQVVAWFRKRREVTFERVTADDGTSRIRLVGGGQRITPPLSVIIHCADSVSSNSRKFSGLVTEIPWNGESEIEPQPTTQVEAAQLIGIRAE